MDKKDGIETINTSQKSVVNSDSRITKHYKLWRKSVLERDSYACQDCGKREGRLVVHHIKMFQSFPELWLDLSNGVVLCLSCHRHKHSLVMFRGKKRWHLPIAPEIHDAILFYAKSKEITITEAVYNLLTLALGQENIKWKILEQ